MLDILAFKATDVPAKNIMTNGDFSDPAGIWTGTNSICTIENGELTIATSPSLTNRYIRAGRNFTDPVSIGEVVYASCLSYIEGSEVDKFRALSFSEDDGAFTNRYGDFDLTPDAWVRQSAVRTYVTNASAGWIKYEIFQLDQAPTSIKVKNVIFINLTKTFGSGNEPTKEQMDALLERFPDSWFDGTRNLFNAKHFMGMYFKKITELENAITMLGGGS